jgi:hypothetical protein
MWKIVHFIIKRFEIQLIVNFRTIKIDDVAYKKLNNLLVYDSIRDKFFESNDMFKYDTC